jgi:hypothetical protein
MRLISLESGSNGNCVYVESDGVRLALTTHRKILGDRLPVFVATRYEASGVMDVR